MAKQWSVLFTSFDHQDGATGVRFGDDAKYVASVGLDRSLRFYAPLRQMDLDDSSVSDA